MEVERRAVGALLPLSRLPAMLCRPGGGRALRGPLPGPSSGPEPPRPRESGAPPSTGPLGARTSASPSAAAPRRPPRARAGPPRIVCIWREPGSEDECESPRVSQVPGRQGALLAGAVSPDGSDPRETGTRTLWSRCSWAVRSEDVKCCPL